MDVVFTAGDGNLICQAKYLSRTIRLQNQFDQTFVFIPSDEISSIPDSLLTEFRNHHTIIVDDTPIKGYPVSNKILGLTKAATVGSGSQIMLLDTDTLILDDFIIPENKDVYLKPAHLETGQYWLSEQAEVIWEQLYNEFGLPRPSDTVTSTVDSVESKPYFNAGVVISNIDSFGEQWLSWTRRVYETIPHHKVHADQIALGLLYQVIDVGILDERYNYPLPLYLRVPNFTKILHYHRLPYLTRVLNPKVRKLLSEINAYNSIYENWSPQNLFFSRYSVFNPLKRSLGRKLRRRGVWR